MLCVIFNFFSTVAVLLRYAWKKISILHFQPLFKGVINNSKAVVGHIAQTQLAVLSFVYTVVLCIPVST